MSTIYVFDQELSALGWSSPDPRHQRGPQVRRYGRPDQRGRPYRHGRHVCREPERLRHQRGTQLGGTADPCGPDAGRAGDDHPVPALDGRPHGDAHRRKHPWLHDHVDRRNRHHGGRRVERHQRVGDAGRVQHGAVVPQGDRRHDHLHLRGLHAEKHRDPGNGAVVSPSRAL
jgi:hypothetical protein